MKYLMLISTLMLSPFSYCAQSENELPPLPPGYATPEELLKNPPPPSELQLVMEKHRTTITGHDLPEGKVLRRAFGEVLGRARLNVINISQDDQSRMQTALLGVDKQKRRSDATLDKACKLISDDSTDIYVIASLVMRADEEDDSDLTERYLDAYQFLSSETSRLVDQSAVMYRTDMQSTSTDLAAVSLERPIDVRRFFTDGCERRKRKGIRKTSEPLVVDLACVHQSPEPSERLPGWAPHYAE